MSVFVNKVEITESEIGQEMQHHPAPSRERAWQLAAQSLVIRQLLLQQAVDSGLLTSAEVDEPGEREEQAIDLLLQRDVTVPEADEETCKRFYDSHPGSFKDAETGERFGFGNVHEQIRSYLHTKAMRAAVAEYIRALSLEAKIKGIELVNL
jgi:hypothetical protein